MVMLFILFSFLFYKNYYELSAFLSDYAHDLLQYTLELCKEGSQTSSHATPKPLCADYDTPAKSDAIRQHKSRFSIQYNK